ncbi:MAG: hypothetical protein C0507_18840 [Cyanobacteria bacterium PR.3.49]|nr:hypothetical protein [Cyanobacteria bacterium PR.3.49]
MSSIIETYSRLAQEYESPENLNSCWGKMTKHCVGLTRIDDNTQLAVEIGCGPGIELTELAAAHPSTNFIGIEPAQELRNSATARISDLSNARVMDGRFEQLPLANHCADYIFSILAFHWTTDLPGSAKELSRVLKPDGQMDLLFIGRHNGNEFIKQTSPIYQRLIPLRTLMESVSMRQQMTVEAADQLFRPVFEDRLSVTESYHTYFDTLDGHWSWWCRIEGQFINIEPEIKADCDREVKSAIADLETVNGIPYTIHLLHVSVKS